MMIPFWLPVGHVLKYGDRRMRFEEALGDGILRFRYIDGDEEIVLVPVGRDGGLGMPTVIWLIEQFRRGRVVDPDYSGDVGTRKEDLRGLDRAACITIDPLSGWRFDWADAALRAAIKKTEKSAKSFIAKNDLGGRVSMTEFRRPRRITGRAKPDPNDLEALARSERAQHGVEEIWIDNDRHRAILNDIRTYMRVSSDRRRTGRAPLTGRRLSQFSQVGKSAIAEQLVREVVADAAAAGLPENPYRVVHITIDPRMTLKMLYQEILNRLADDFSDTPGKPADRKRFYDFCVAYDAEIASRRITSVQTCLVEEDVLASLIEASGGHIGRAARIIQVALPAAMARGAVTLEAYDLSNAVRDFAMEVGWVDYDPFAVPRETAERVPEHA